MGPRPDGSFPPEETERLLGLGKWLNANGEAIYGTSASPLAEVPTWGRVTRSGSKLYLILLDVPPAASALHVRMPYRVVRARMLDSKRDVVTRAAGDGIDLDLPKITSTDPTVVELEVQGLPPPAGGR